MSKVESKESFIILEQGTKTKRQITNPMKQKVPSRVFFGQHEKSGAIGAGVFWEEPDPKKNYRFRQNGLFSAVRGDVLMLRLIRGYRAMVLATASQYLSQRILNLYTSLVSGEPPREAWEKKYVNGFRESMARDAGLRYSFEDVFRMVPPRLEEYLDRIDATSV
jgi:hypothetical protein